MLKVLLAAVLALVVSHSTAHAKPRPFWLIAHRCNSLTEIPLVLERGFNGMEIDVQWCNGNIAVDHDFCGPGYTSWEDWIKTVESQPSRRLHHFALLILDLKEYSPELVMRLRDDLRRSPVLKKIPRIFSVNNVDAARNAFTEEFIKDLNPRVEGIDISEGQPPDSVIGWYNTVKVRNQSRWYADGVCAACFFGQDQVDSHLHDAVDKRGRTGIHRVYSWTYQSVEEVRNKLGSGIDGLVVNTGAGIVDRGDRSYYEWAEEYETLMLELSRTIRYATAKDF